MSAPTAANLARLCELAELCAVVSSAQIAEAFLYYHGHIDEVAVRIYHVGCSCTEGIKAEFSRTAYMSDRLAGCGETRRMDELLAELRAFLADRYSFSLVRAAAPALNLEA